jgi:uncharacterized protein YeaO (DUF488 family)
MTLRIVRLGSPRAKDEGTRIGTVRPNLAPSAETVKQAQAAETPAQWAAFVKRYRAEMAEPERAHELALLAQLSHTANFSVGCYCEDEARCHRSVLRALLKEQGAKVED